MYAGADLLVLSRTKSGRTWLRVMLSHLYHLRYGVPENELLHFDNLHRLEPRIPKVHFSHDTTFAHHRPGGRALTARPEQRLLFLVRDPRDVAVSFFHHVRQRASARELEHKDIPPEARDLLIDDFVLHERYGAPEIVAFLNRWWAEAPQHPQALFLRYEDLRRDAEAELARVAGFLGESFSAEELRQAVDFASIEQLRERERSGYFESGRLGPTDSDDPNSYKVRQGRVGGYRAEVSAETAEALDRLVAERLEPAYGYRAGGEVAPMERPAKGAKG